MDGWTSKRHESIYNYIVTTPERKEYLVALCNYSMESHIGEFLATEISEIVEKIGLDKFAAVVTDNASNCRVARKKIEEKYNHILDLRCIAHAINLIATDLVKLDNIKDFISKCGKITRFFNNSHKASAILSRGLSNMKINIEGLQTWCKTRWGSLYPTTDSILRARPVFDWVRVLFFLKLLKIKILYFNNFIY